jgi:hypothetical protein
VPNCPAADIRLGNLVHADCGLDPGRLADILEGILQRKRIDDRPQHSHVVCRDPVHAALAGGIAADDIAASDHDGELRAISALHPDDLLSDCMDDTRIDAESPRGGQGLAAELQEHALVSGRRGRLDHSS